MTDIHRYNTENANARQVKAFFSVMCTDDKKSIWSCSAAVRLILVETQSRRVNMGSQTKKNMGKTVTPFEHKLMGSREEGTSWKKWEGWDVCLQNFYTNRREVKEP